jgi:2-keto-3-deoxy-L-rhamnonate aldolase RhmA
VNTEERIARESRRRIAVEKLCDIAEDAMAVMTQAERDRALAALEEIARKVTERGSTQ